MPSISVNDLPTASALVGTEVVHGLQSAASRKITPNQIADFIADRSGGVWVDNYGAVANGTTDDSTAVRNALDAAIASGKPLIFGQGNYNLPNWSAPTTGLKVTIRGAGRGLTNLVGVSGRSFVILTGGGSFTSDDIGFINWDSACRLADNTSSGAYTFLGMNNCYLESINFSSIWDGGLSAPGGITTLSWCNNLSVNCGRVATNSAALRLDVNDIASAFVDKNEIRGVGGSTFTGQKQGIQLGALSRLSRASIIVTNNRIYDVQNSDTANVSGILVFGYNTIVANNTIHSVKSASTSNVDQYGIYHKSAYSLIADNILTDAGGNAACIMSKGYPNDAAGLSLNSTNEKNLICRNTIRIEGAATARWTTQSLTGITVYNGGNLIADNIIEGVNTGINEIAPLYAAVSNNTIRGNKLSRIVGRSGQNAIAIQTKSPTRTLIDSNDVVGVGSGVETLAYGILMSNDAEGVYGSPFNSLTIKNNTLRVGSAATASNTRAIMLSFYASGTYSGAILSANEIDGFGRGVQIAYAGTVSGVDVRNNILRNCSVSSFGTSGTVVNDGVMEGNSVDGLTYTTPVSGTTSPSILGLNHVILTNSSATSVVNFTGGHGNQRLLVEITNGNTTIVHSSSLILSGSANWTPSNGGMLNLIRSGGVWKEVSRTAY